MQPRVTQHSVALLQQNAIAGKMLPVADWDDYRFAAAVAHAGTVRGAAKALGVHASTVTRRIDHFERRLGVSLFERSVRGLLLTAEGRQIVDALDDVAAQLQAVERKLRRGGAEMAGVVSLSISPALAPDLLMPALKTLLDEFPAITVQQRARWTAADLEAHEVDVALVVLDQPPEDLIGRPGGTMALGAWGDADMASRWPDGGIWLPSRLQQEAAPDYVVDGVAIGGALDTPALQLAAVAAGLGASLVPCYQAQKNPDLLELPLSRVHPQIWILSHPDARGVRRVQMLASCLADAVRASGALAQA
jgi:DNA-binding transcriptional LysR family regulator